LLCNVLRVDSVKRHLRTTSRSQILLCYWRKIPALLVRILLGLNIF